MKRVGELGISPSPWNVLRNGEIVSQEGFIFGIKKYDFGCRVVFTTEADARLIAAAPDLYEALRGLLKIVCLDCNSSYTVDGKCVKCPKVVAAESALEKAGGDE